MTACLPACPLVQSGELVFTVTAPYSRTTDKTDSIQPMPWYSPDSAFEMLNKHGLFVRAIGACAARGGAACAPCGCPHAVVCGGRFRAGAAV